MCALSALADYMLMSPAECYKPFMAEVMFKIQLSKVVIELLTSSPDASYEDLLNHLQTAGPPKGQTTASFTEDDLLRYSQWIVDQVFSVSVLPSLLSIFYPVFWHSSLAIGIIVLRMYLTFIYLNTVYLHLCERLTLSSSSSSRASPKLEHSRFHELVLCPGQVAMLS